MTLPERLGRLRRVDRIGAGGFATVWLYHDDDLDSPVAVKALADNWAQRDDIRERFLEEARMLRRADSEHVVRIYDIGEVDQTPYFVMSYADRGSLATLTERGPIPAERAVELIGQAGLGVHVLHQRGIIHRDIKPQNLLLRSGDDDAEEVLVADLGVAKAMLHASGLTQVVGTPAYMAPEQAIGLGIDRRADIHALGAVAYHLMTGRYAREGGVADLADPHLPLPPSSTRPELASYDDVLLRSLAPRAEDRWPDVPTFVAALRSAERAAASSAYAFLYEPPAAATNTDTVYLQRTSAEPMGPMAPTSSGPPMGAGPREPRRRSRVLLVLAAVVVVVAAVLGAAFGVPHVLGDAGGPARSPSQSTSDPSSPLTSAPVITPSPDIDYPALGPVDLTVRHQVVAPNGSIWSYRVPKGWVASSPSKGIDLHGKQIDEQTEIRWRPEDETDVGGYSLRFKALNPVLTPDDMRVRQTNAMRSVVANGNAFELHIFKHRPGNGLWFTYIDGFSHLRYNFFRWLSVPSGNAGLEVSVAGREADQQGLQLLLDGVITSVYPVS